MLLYPKVLVVYIHWKTAPLLFSVPEQIWGWGRLWAFFCFFIGQMAMWFTAGIFDQKWVIHFIDSPEVIQCAMLQHYEMGGVRVGGCPRDLVLAQLSSSICGSWSERALFHRKIKTCQRVTLLFPQYLANVKLFLVTLGVGKGVKFLKSFYRYKRYRYKDQREASFLNFHPLLAF